MVVDFEQRARDDPFLHIVTGHLAMGHLAIGHIAMGLIAAGRR